MRVITREFELATSEIKGYLPGVTDHIEVHLRPGADHPDDRLRLMTGGYEALSVGD